MKKSSDNLAMHVSWVTIIINTALSLIKLLAGIVAKSSAMISDAVHSASDVFSTVIVMIGIRASGKSSDKEHPYGHERIECIASILLAVALFMTGAFIGWDALKSIHTKSYVGKDSITAFALIAAFISIAVKEWMYWYTRSVAKKLNSISLMADAWHHRSDAFSSVGALIGIALSMAGYPIFDPIASIIICVLILQVAIDIFKQASNQMIDTAADDETIERIRKTISSVEGVIEINKLYTRLFASKMYVDVEFSADAGLTLKEAHSIAHRVHDLLEADFPEIKHCMVHVNPHEK